jgi:tetratricopeptide (TPR) repeat protein
VASGGALRAQRYVEVMVAPLLFCPVTRQLSVIDQIEITLTFNNPQGELRQNVGIFNKVATTAFINYEDDGTSALINDKAFEKAGFVRGNVQWKKIDSAADVLNITADYLIICANDFYPSGGTPHAQVLRLANHRASYNGFDVMILNVEDIISDVVGFYFEEQSNPPPYEHKKEQRMRTCIRTIYETGVAHHTGDGKLGYVLLVGDNYVGNTGMPTSYDQNVYFNPLEKFPSDYYFTCVTKVSGSYSNIGSLYLGRFSVETDQHLRNMVQKTINHESEYSPQAWRYSAGFTNCDLNTEYIPVFCNFVTDLVNNYGWLNCSIVNGGNSTISAPTINYLNAGVTFAQIMNGWSDKIGWPAGDLNTYYLPNLLHNEYKAPFISTIASYTGWFDDEYCFAEFITRYDSIKGAVGYIGVSRGIHFEYDYTTITYSYQEFLPYVLFHHKIPIAGELSMISKVYCFTLLPSQTRHAFNLFGDPALNIMAEGYEVTRDIATDYYISVIKSPVRVHNNATLTISENNALLFFQNGQLIIEEDGHLNIEDNAELGDNFCETWPTIHVIGGGLSVGNNVVFNNLNNILLDNGWVPPYHINKQYNLRGATFYNTPLTHRHSRLNLSNCTFNAGSNLLTYFSKSIIDSCTFNATKLTSNHSIWIIISPIIPTTTIRNCHFNGYGSNNTAILLNKSTKYNISNNVITGYNTGISLTESGETLSSVGKGIDPGTPQATSLDLIYKNTISNCGRGIELYSSVGHFKSNHIFNNGLGIALYNNSNTSFGTINGPDTPNQIIQDNDSYELYASRNSFPTIFRYNQIIDEDNFGNTYDDPMIYWDLDTNGKYPSSMVRDVKLNCWGDNFDPLEDFYPSKYFAYEPIWQCGKSTSTMPDVDEILYQIALTYFIDENYSNAETAFKELVETYPQSPFAVAALHELFALEQFLNNDYAALQEYYASFTPNDTALFNVADFLATRCNVVDKNWQPAIDWYENRIVNPPSYQDSVFAVIDLGDIHLMMAGDTLGTKGKPSCYYTLAHIKPNSKAEYEENKSELLATLPKIEKPHTSPSIPQTFKKGVLSQNIPNPANGSTMVVYDILEEGTVEIRLYNSLGQLLKSLPQGTLVEGTYRMNISLTGLPAGLYHYILFVNGEQTDAKKLIVN